MNSIPAALRRMRILHIVFLAVPVLYLVALLQIHPAERKVPRPLLIGLVFVCVFDIGLAFLRRAQKVTVGEERLRVDPEDEGALTKWQAGVILSLVHATTVVFFGVVLKFVGAKWDIAGAFFIVGIVLTLFWTPKLDIPAAS